MSWHWQVTCTSRCRPSTVHTSSTSSGRCTSQGR
jgi:hypothetical protein